MSLEYTDKNKVFEYINSLNSYSGYVQFSHRKFDKKIDLSYKDNKIIFDDKDKENGFIYEAYFYSEKENQSITIRQINNKWIISTIDTKNIKEKLSYHTILGHRVIMGQLWEKEKDSLCLDLEVNRLKKVVFMGFEGDINE